MDNEKTVQNEVVEEPKAFTIKDLLFIIRKNLILIIVIVLVATGIGAWYSRTIKPTYTATCQVKVKAVLTYPTTDTSSGKSYVSYNDITLTEKMPTRLKDFINTPTFIKRAREKYGSNALYSGGISLSANENSDIIRISYTDGAQEDAKKKVGAIFQALKDMTEERDENDKPEWFDFEVTVIDMSNPGTNFNYPTSMNLSRNRVIVIALVLGVVIAAVVVFLRYILDDTITTKDELERITGLKNFAYIADIDYKNISKKSTNENAPTEADIKNISESINKEISEIVGDKPSASDGKEAK